MKKLVTLLLMFVAVLAQAQQFSGKISDYALETADVVIFPFGMDYPIKIGTADKQGNVIINLDAADISKIPADTKDLFFGRVAENFFENCDNPDRLQISNEIKAIKCGMPALWFNKQWAGTFTLVSDEKLQPWIEDRYFMEPVKASFFEILYVDNDLSLTTSCTTTYNLSKENVESAKNFNLKLKKGFNLIQYKIDEIHKTDPNETSSIPSKFQITNPADDNGIKWLVKYF
jgi:hypothetical protein